jgi:hypothetical protein
MSSPYDASDFKDLHSRCCLHAQILRNTFNFSKETKKSFGCCILNPHASLNPSVSASVNVVRDQTASQGNQSTGQDGHGGNRELFR